MSTRSEKTYMVSISPRETILGKKSNYLITEPTKKLAPEAGQVGDSSASIAFERAQTRQFASRRFEVHYKPPCNGARVAVMGLQKSGLKQNPLNRNLLDSEVLVQFKAMVSGQQISDSFYWPIDRRDLSEMKMFATNLIVEALNRQKAINIDPREVECKSISC